MDEATSESLVVPLRRGTLSRIDRMIQDAPEFAFRGRGHFVEAAVLSFLSFKERELAAIRRGERWR